ncbi:flagellin [Thermodesulfovibrio aggregans]|uniref:Flagellin n=1 Tax=Thermodesulfovibrio aggregans TaxID=86166 RepID=A0A0U9HQE1_9BACT|nr:flagellin [Thermodesulfovibrio aggregans]GAQ95251.1 flagellin [Thermodesulfovibrio aggregans]
MALRINFNAEATVTHTALLRNERAMNKSLLRISTGQRILSAADDAAGLFIADQLAVVAAALDQGNRNIQTGISALQIAESNVGQIFEKLQTIYTKAQSAANDINDPNARAALQRDISNLVDAIQKIGTDTEYNGIKLLDGTFANKVIHYGARADQTITVGINSVKADSLGAYMVTGTYTTNSATASASQTTVNNGYTATSGAVTGAFLWSTGDTAKVAGIDVSNGLSFAVDAKTIADNINSSTTLQNAGISARAVNQSIAAAGWTDIQAGTGQSVTIKFFVGSASSAPITVNVSAGETLTLSQLVSKINSQASANNTKITARAENNRLVLTTEGQTIGLEVSVSADVPSSGTSIISVDMAQFLGLNATGKTVSATNTTAGTATASATGSAIQVGKLVIMGTDSYNYDFTGITGSGSGLGISNATGTSEFKNLYSLDVTTNENAELALDIVKTAIQRVDKIRTQIGSVINNLQAIWDGQKTSYDNTKEAENVIRNTDFAAEMSTFITMQIRMQSGVAMLAQANALPQLVLQLLR